MAKYVPTARQRGQALAVLAKVRKLDPRKRWQVDWTLAFGDTRVPRPVGPWYPVLRVGHVERWLPNFPVLMVDGEGRTPDDALARVATSLGRHTA